MATGNSKSLVLCPAHLPNPSSPPPPPPLPPSLLLPEYLALTFPLRDPQGGGGRRTHSRHVLVPLRAHAPARASAPPMELREPPAGPIGPVRSAVLLAENKPRPAAGPPVRARFRPTAVAAGRQAGAGLPGGRASRPGYRLARRSPPHADWPRSASRHV